MREKSKRIHKFAALVLGFALISACLAAGAGAAQDVFVNGEALPFDLGEAWAVGSGGAAQLGADEVWVLTGSGMQQLGGGQAAAGDPEHLAVTGSYELDYDKIRVGLDYNPGRDYANLENAVGSGYSFGYYDSNREFHELAYTSETRITMAPDLNVSVPGGSVGCYHVLMPGSYDSFDAAQAAASAYSDGFPAWYDGTYRVLRGSYTTAAAAQSAAAQQGGSCYTASNRCVTVTRTSGARILFEFDGGASLSLAVEPRGGSAETWFSGYRYRGGFEYQRRDGAAKLTVINVVGIEDYVKGVLPHEMSPGWPAEALKAQAVCARTYAASHFNGYQSSYGFDVTNDTYSQVYRGTSGADESTDAAVDATAGVYITYAGELIDAMYYSSNGGGSESSENVMYSALPYLRGKLDPYEAAAGVQNSFSSWRRSLTAQSVTDALNAAGYQLGTVTGIETSPSESGNVIGITFRDASGRSVSLEKSACYNFVTARLGLYSIRFEVDASADGFVFSGSGWGHSVGMSQYGANAMASVYGFTYDQIISFYYTGVALSRGV